MSTSCEELTHWKRLWFWERLRAGGEGDDKGWDGWMASPTLWTWWVWVNSGSWWWTGRPGVLLSMGSQRVRHDWATELNCGYLSLTEVVEKFAVVDPHAWSQLFCMRLRVYNWDGDLNILILVEELPSFLMRSRSIMPLKLTHSYDWPGCESFSVSCLMQEWVHTRSKLLATPGQ